MAQKKDTRKTVLKQRGALAQQIRERKSQAICRKFADGIRHAVESGTLRKPAGDSPLRIAAYEPMNSEVDVHPLLFTALDDGCEVFLPCMVTDTPANDPRMAFFRVGREQITVDRPAFLDHPARAFPLCQLLDEGWSEADPALFDVAVIPLVAFDDSLMRLGYGGGNYDRFLPKLRHDCFVAGVAFEEQRIAKVPTEPHDLPLPRIYTA